MRAPRLGLPYLAVGLIAAGVFCLIHGTFAMNWQPVPAWVPGRTALAYATAALEVALGAGLLWGRTRATASRVLFGFVLVWWLLLDVPSVVAAPLVEGNWLELGMLGTLLAASWVLWDAARGRGDASGRGPRLLLGLALIPTGLSHFFYLSITVGMVPGWLPGHTAWALLTGAAHLAAGLGILAGVLPRLAAQLEAGMLTIFTLLVWVPAVVAAPGSRSDWSELLTSWIIGAAVWVVADSFGDVAWTARTRSPVLPS
jgi:uncharacterized membrane protein